MSSDPSPSLQSGAAQPWRLAASLDLGAAEDLLVQMREAARDGGAVLDGSAVERVAVPCLQVLAAAARAVPGLRIVAPSAALVAAVGDLGLSAAIPLES